MSQPDEKLVLEGGKVKLETQRRQLLAPDQGGVIIDYLRFTVVRDRLVTTHNMPVDSDDENLVRLLAMHLSSLLGYSLGALRPGRDYYDHTYTIENSFGHEIASVSGGGESQRGTFCFTVKGEGCTFAAAGWERRTGEFFADLLPKITRIDLAKDCWNKGELSIDAAVDAYKDHRFSYQKRLPSYVQFGCWLDGHSRTFQVGKRESGKLIRVYEKGHQFGMMDDEWCRAEVELRSVNRIIPWEALTQPGEYFAGAYEWCNWLLHEGMQNIVPRRVKTQAKVGELSVARAFRNIERVMAPTLVLLTSAFPDFVWLERLVLAHAQRKTPRGFRGLPHSEVVAGLKKSFSRFEPHHELAPLADFKKLGF